MTGLLAFVICFFIGGFIAILIGCGIDSFKDCCPNKEKQFMDSLEGFSLEEKN